MLCTVGIKKPIMSDSREILPEHLPHEIRINTGLPIPQVVENGVLKQDMY